MKINDAKSLVEEIQQALMTGSVPPEEVLIDLAGRHEEYVDTVSKRLETVESLLDDGRHDEGVELAERAPAVNDLVTILDFPELSAWNSLLLSENIPAVRELPMDVVARLADAYSHSAPFEKLLNVYRRQSLARTSVEQRLKTLRQLAQHDPSGDQWTDDIKLFERQVLQEAAGRLKSAVAERDIKTVAQIDRDLKGRWKVKVPDSLKERAATAHQNLRESAAREELQAVAPALSDAYAAFDSSKGFELRARFRSLCDLARLPPTDAVFDLAGPALEWLEEEEQRQRSDSEFEQAIADLETAVDGEADVAELQQLYGRATRQGRPLPESLENRLADRVETLKAADARRRMMTLTGIVASCVVAIIAVSLFLHQRNFHTNVEEHARQLARLVDAIPQNGDLEAADEYIETVRLDNESYLKEPPILGPLKTLESHRKSELGRRRRLEQFIETADSVGKDWRDVDRGLKALADAQGITLNEQEKARIQKAELHVQGVRNELQAQVDERFQQDLSALQDLIQGLPTDSLSGYQAAAERANELQSRNRLSQQQRDLVKGLISKVSAERSLVAEKMAVAASVARITENTSSVVPYRQSLIKYTKDHPQSHRSSDFLQVAQQDADHWKSIEAWNDLKQKLEQTVFRLIEPDEAKALALDVERLLSKASCLKPIAKTNQHIAALKSISMRARPDRALSAELSQFLSADLFANAWQLTTTNGTRYLLREPPTVTSSRIEFRYFSSANGTTVEEETISRTQIANADRPDKEWLSPHSRLVRELRKNLEEDLQDDFEQAIQSLVLQIMDDGDTDPILKVLLLSRILELGTVHSSFLSEHVLSIQQNMASLGITQFTNWVAPENREAMLARRKAITFFEDNATKLEEGLREAVRDRDNLRGKPVGPEIHCVGWLMKQTGQWELRLAEELQSGKPQKIVTLTVVDDEPKLVSLDAGMKGAVGSLELDQVPAGTREGQRAYVLRTSFEP